jgi:hypothetical protein
MFGEGYPVRTEQEILDQEENSMIEYILKIKNDYSK